ncbi:hypothetical protein JAAARDRAFT_199652 [Jaapia argillacea MUCL 33604]|uniref:Uncharacterized protein n=1 Tax=Jaapia argillacea MUCL 33604 TaxID=933084 RepID=A0A067P7Q6_9AGAM|nr:hypothetical protein JAAARDRAFT_199652 [Jaapia argillacea MUCL 33604]
MLSVVDAIYLYNHITPTAHFFISPRYTRNEHGEVIDCADVIKRERSLIEALTVTMHRPTASELLEEAKGVVYYPTPVITICYNPSKNLQADASILPPLTHLHLSKLPMVEPGWICIDSDTDITSSASYHPNSLTSSLHKSDYQPISPLLSALGDSSFTSTTDLDLEERHP